MKKRSSTKRQPEFIFFTDRDLGQTVIPGALERAGVQVERHDSHFSPITLDTEWLQFVGHHGWLAFSRNRRIRYTTDERDVTMRAGLALFLLVSKGTHAELADGLVQTLPKIIAFRGRHKPPFIAKVYRPATRRPMKPGRVVMHLTRDDWERALKLGAGRR